MQNPRLKQKEKLDTRLDKTLQTIVIIACRLSENPRVGGSNPPPGTIYK